MEKDNHLSAEQSLAIIQHMINQAKANISTQGFSWLVWGIMLFLASLLTYVFIRVQASHIFLAWNIFGIISILLLIYDVVKSNKKIAKTYVDELLKMVDIGFFICIFMIIFAINTDAVDPANGFGFFLVIFAFLMLVKGSAVKSKSLIIGAAVNWVAAVAVFLIKDFKSTMLIMSVAVLIGYIIPGIILLRAEHKKAIDNSITN